MASEDIRAEAAAAYRGGRADEALRLLEPHCLERGAGQDWLTLGRLKRHLGDAQGARRALEVASKFPATSLTAHRLLAQWLAGEGDAAAACAQLAQYLTAAPTDAQVWGELASAQEQAGRLDAALTSYSHALALAPADSHCRLNRAALLRAVNRFEEALADYAVLLAQRPAQALLWSEQGECLRQCRRYAESIASCERALAFNPSAVPALMCKAVALAMMGAVEAAQQCFNQAFALDRERAARYGDGGLPLPQVPDARSVYLAAAFARLSDADWSGYGEMLAAALRYFALAAEAPSDLSGAFPLLYLPLPNALRSAGHIAITAALKAPSLPPLAPSAGDPRRLRIGYLSCKFKDHPGMVLTGGLFRAHDRTRFEVFGYAINRDDHSTQRRLVRNEFDHFIDLAELDDEAAAQRIRADRIDILVDLNGYSDEARPLIMAARPAPLQFAYLGHSHSLFAPWIDYRITDRASEPSDWGHALLEARAFMPASFYPYDVARHVLGSTPSRAALGLPERAFVLCGFTRVEKIEPRLFERWLQLLHALPDAVLWLGPASPAATAALRTRAVQRGLAAERLVFVERINHAAHLARHRAADLFLDTWTFNAHTTGLDALQAGLPMVTLQGVGWSARYGASLLHAVGLQELITTSPEDYCALVMALAHDRPRLRRLRAALEQRIRAANPFAPERMAPHLGAIYSEAWARYRAGARPTDFEIS